MESYVLHTRESAEVSNMYWSNVIPQRQLQLSLSLLFISHHRSAISATLADRSTDGNAPVQLVHES